MSFKREDLRAVYVHKDTHQRLRLYCLRHKIKMAEFLNPLVEAAVDKPSREEMVERAKAELTTEEVAQIDAEDAQIPLAEVPPGVTWPPLEKGMINVLE
jgi:hypothetical protein